jgi:hypothetical protein
MQGRDGSPDLGDLRKAGERGLDKLNISNIISSYNSVLYYSHPMVFDYTIIKFCSDINSKT